MPDPTTHDAPEGAVDLTRMVLLGVAMTDCEAQVFRRFARNHKPGYHDDHIQLEGNKQLARVAAGHRLMKKGVLIKYSACHWYLTDLGKRMAVEWQKQNDQALPRGGAQKGNDHAQD